LLQAPPRQVTHGRQRLLEEILPAQLRGAHSGGLPHTTADGLDYSIQDEMPSQAQLRYTRADCH